jgi:hypothetical protein
MSDGLDKWRKWPSAPEEERPKALYVNEGLPEVVTDWLREERGWKVVDVRVMPNRSDGDRAESVKAFLEGVRCGSIEASKDLLRYIELEARICGLLSNKQRADDMVPKVEGDTLEQILDFGKGKRQKAS